MTTNKNTDKELPAPPQLKDSQYSLKGLGGIKETVNEGGELDAVPATKGHLSFEEKDRRIYYQSIVYEICNIMDGWDRKKPGHGIVCGTIEEPSRQVQDWLIEMLKVATRDCAMIAKMVIKNSDREKEIAQMREEIRVLNISVDNLENELQELNSLLMPSEAIGKGLGELIKVRNELEQERMKLGMMENFYKVAMYRAEKAEKEHAQSVRELIEAKEANKVLLCFVAQERAARTEAEKSCAEMREALIILIDEQNGAPLIRREAHWNNAMGLANKSLSTSCGKGYASPELVKEAVEALKSCEFKEINPGREGEDSYMGQVFDEKLVESALSALACLNQKEKDSK